MCRRAGLTVQVGICITARQILSRSSAISRWEYNRYLNKLVAWAWFNGLLTSRTRLYIKGNGIVDLPKLQEMVADVSHHFPLRLPAPTPKALYSPCEIRHLAIIVNLEYDPTAAFRNQVVHFDFRKLDVFSFGENQNCLVGSVDLLYRNSWNEVRTLHFNGRAIDDRSPENYSRQNASGRRTAR